MADDKARLSSAWARRRKAVLLSIAFIGIAFVVAWQMRIPSWYFARLQSGFLYVKGDFAYGGTESVDAAWSKYRQAALVWFWPVLVLPWWEEQVACVRLLPADAARLAAEPGWRPARGDYGIGGILGVPEARGVVGWEENPKALSEVVNICDANPGEAGYRAQFNRETGTIRYRYRDYGM